MLPFLVFLIGSVLLSVIDYQVHRLPNRIVFALIALIALAVLIQRDLNLFGGSLKFASLYFLIFLGLAFISKNAIGFGDVKYSFACGQIVGTYVPDVWLEILWSMFAIAAIVSIALMALGKLTRFDRIAFGPYMALSTIAFVANSLG